MKKVFISYPFRDLYALETISFLQKHFSPYDYDLLFAEGVVPQEESFNIGIAESINKCSVFLCIMDTHNPNIMFELGYALGKNKKIIIVGFPSLSIPLDVRGMSFIQYGSDPYDILSLLEKKLDFQEKVSPFYDLAPSHLQNNLENLLETPELLDNIDSKDFEELIRQWFEYKDFCVEQTRISRDGGYDFMITPFNESNAIVEVKKYKATAKVPVSIVRQLVGAMALEKVSNGIIVSSAPFTNSARYFAEQIEPKIFLWTIGDLVKHIKTPNNGIHWKTSSAVSK